MKSFQIHFLFILGLILFTTLSQAQEENKNSGMYSVHVDHVKPSMFMEYEEILKEFVAFLKENDVENFNYLSSVTEEYKYSYVSPVDKMADFDTNPLSQIKDEASQKKLKELFDKMDKCYDRHGNYMLHLDSDLTYMPDGFSQTTPGESYRVYYTQHYEPSNAEAIYEAAKALKQVHVDNQSKSHYRVYHSGFGVVGNYLLFALSAKDPVDSSNKSKANWDLMGDAFGKALNNLMKYSSKVEVERAWIREDLGYNRK